MFGKQLSDYLKNFELAVWTLEIVYCFPLFCNMMEHNNLCIDSQEMQKCVQSYFCFKPCHVFLLPIIAHLFKCQLVVWQYCVADWHYFQIGDILATWLLGNVLILTGENKCEDLSLSYLLNKHFYLCTCIVLSHREDPGGVWIFL